MTTIETPAELGDASGFGVKLTATLPRGDKNGLRPWARLLAQQPTEVHYAICQIDTARKIEDVDADTDTAVVRILRIEIVASADTDEADDLMLKAFRARGGDPQLFDDETNE